MFCSNHKNCNCCSIVTGDRHVLTKLDDALNFVLKRVKKTELNTFLSNRNLEIATLLIVLAISVRKPQLAVFPTSAKCCGVFHTKVAMHEFMTAKNIYHNSIIAIAVSQNHHCFQKNTVDYVDPTNTRQTIEYAPPISCDNSPETVGARGPDTDDGFFVDRQTR